MQASIWTRSISMSWPVRLTIKREVAPQISAQSEQVRIHWRISIGSALQASAHDVHISEQYMAWRAAFASSSFRSLPTSGCNEIIFSIDIAFPSQAHKTLHNVECSRWARQRVVDRRLMRDPFGFAERFDPQRLQTDSQHIIGAAWDPG
jgi:hypothetical protein